MKKYIIIAASLLITTALVLFSCQESKIEVTDYEIAVDAYCSDTDASTGASGKLFLTKGETSWEYTLAYKIDGDASLCISSDGYERKSPASVTFDFEKEFVFQMPVLSAGHHTFEGVVTSSKGKTSNVSCKFDVVDTKIEATGIDAPDEMTVEIEQKTETAVSIVPSDATDKSMTLSIDKPTIVSASLAGDDAVKTLTVDGRTVGEAIVTLKTGTVSKDVKVTVTEKPTETITIDPTSMTIGYEQSKTFTVQSSGGYTYDIPEGTVVASSGNILAVKNKNTSYRTQETGITVTNKADSTVTASATLTLEPKPENLEMTVTTSGDAVTIKVGGDNDGWEVVSIPDGLDKSISGESIVLTNSTYEDITGDVTIRTKIQKVTESIRVKVPAKTDYPKALALTPDSWTIIKGDKLEVKATVTYESGQTADCTSSVSWQASTNLTGSGGSYKAASIGEATITATLVYDTATKASLTATSKGRIVDKDLDVSDLTISPATFSLKEGDKISFTATATFDDGSTQDVTSSCLWTGTNMTSGGSGSFTATGTGSASVEAEYEYKEKTVSATATGTVSVKETFSLSLGTTSASWEVSSTASKSISVNASSNVSWRVSSNSNSDVFSASGSGSGNGTISVSPRSANTSQSERRATITISGNDVSDVTLELVQYGSSVVAVTGVSVSPKSVTLTRGETTTLSASVSPSNATDRSVTWESGSTSIASVSSTGVVTAKSRGKATITLRSGSNSSIYDLCSVTVNDYSMSTSDGGTSLVWTCDAVNEQYKTIVTSGDWSIESNSNTSAFSARKDGSTLYVKPLSSNTGNTSSRSASIVLRNTSDGNNKLTISATQAADGSDHSYKPTGTYTYGTPVVSLSYSPENLPAEGGSSAASYSFSQQRWEIWQNDLGQTDPQAHEVSTVTSGGSWSFSGSATGFSVNSGNGTVTAQANSSTGSRSVDVTATVKSYNVSGSNTSRVSQSGKTAYSLSVAPSSLSYGVSGGSQTVSVTTNGTWYVSDSPSWVSTSASGSTLTVTVGANGTSSRSGSITVKCSEDESKAATISVSQSADSKTGTEYRNVNVSISAGTTSFPATGGSTTLSYSASYEYRDTYSSGKTGEWVSQSGTPTISGSADGFTRNGSSVTVSQNTTGGSRSVTYYADFSVGGVSAERKSVTLTQSADSKTGTEYRNVKVSISAGTTSFPASGGSTSLSYSASYESRDTYSSGRTGDWTTLTGTPTISGSADGFSRNGSSVTVSQNTTGSSRSVTYYADFSVGGVSAERKSVTLTQSADSKTGTEYRNVTVSLSAGTTSFTAAGGSTSLTASAAYESRDTYASGKTDDWTSHTGTPSLSGGATGFTLSGTSVSVEANVKGQARSATFRADFSIGGVSATQKSVTLNQSADAVSSTEYRYPGVSIAASQTSFPASGGSAVLTYSASYESRSVYVSGYQTEWASSSAEPTISGGAEGFTRNGNKVTVAKNSGSQRSVTYTANFSVGGKSASQKSVTLTQEKGSVDYSISVGQSSVSWAWNGAAKNVSVTCNGTVEIDYSSSNLSYFNVTVGSGQLTLSPKENNTNKSARTGSVTVRCKEDRTRTASISLSQEGSTVICMLSNASLDQSSSWPEGYSGGLSWNQLYTTETVFENGVETPGFSMTAAPAMSDGATYVFLFDIKLYRGVAGNRTLLGTKRTWLSYDITDGDPDYATSNSDFKAVGSESIASWLNNNGMVLKMVMKQK